MCRLLPIADSAPPRTARGSRTVGHWCDALTLIVYRSRASGRSSAASGSMLEVVPYR